MGIFNFRSIKEAAGNVFRKSHSKKQKDAVIWHDWTGESYVWRMMHASAKMTVCSM